MGYIEVIINFWRVLKTPHVRSNYGFKKRETRFTNYLERRQQYDAIRVEVKDHSRCDPASGEKAFHHADRAKINEVLLGSGCCVEKTSSIFTQQPNHLTKHVKTILVETEYIPFEPVAVIHILNWIEDGQVLNRPTN